MSSTVSNQIFRFLQLRANQPQADGSVVADTGEVITVTTEAVKSVISTFIDNNISLASIDTNNFVTEPEVESELENYVRKTGSDIIGSMVLRNSANIIYPDQTEQNTAFTNINSAQLQDVLTRTQQISVNSRFTTIPAFSTNNLIIPDNALTIIKIINLQSTIDTTNSNVTTNLNSINLINDQITVINSTLSDLLTDDNTVANSLSVLNNLTTSHTSSINQYNK